jgi:glutamate carboxypeptidase
MWRKDAGITALFEKAQAIYREIGKELLDVPLTGGGSDGNFSAHAAYEQIYYSSLVPRTYLCTRLLETLD